MLQWPLLVISLSGLVTFGSGPVDWSPMPVTFGPNGGGFVPNDLALLGNTLIGDLSVKGDVGAALAGLLDLSREAYCGSPRKGLIFF